MASILDASAFTYLPQPYQGRLRNAWIENIDVLRYIPIVPSGQRGFKISWLVDVGDPTVNAFPDGYAVQEGEFSTGGQVALMANWAEYRSPFKATRRAITVMAGANGVPAVMNDIVAKETVRHASRMAGQIEADLWNGPGTGDRVLGLKSALAGTGAVYGTVNSKLNAIRRSSFGAASEGKLAQVEQNMFEGHGVRPNVVFMAPDVMTKLANDGVISARREYVNNGPIDISVRPDSFTFQGLPCVRVRSMDPGSLAFINTDSLRIEYMFEREADADAVFLSTVPLMGTSREGDEIESLGMPLILFSLGKDGPSRKFSLDTPSFQLICEAPYLNALVEGITTTLS